jgi:hypothetical protein
MKAKILSDSPISGVIEVKNGNLVNDKNFVDVTEFTIEINDCKLERGAFPTIISVKTGEKSFSFFLRDLSSKFPIYIPEFGLAAVPGDDPRGFQEISAAIKAQSLLSDFDRFEKEPEESYENACSHNRDQYCPTWLGLSRDIRMFRVGLQNAVLCGYEYNYFGAITPVYHSFPRKYEDTDYAYKILFEIGPGVNCRNNVTRRLESGTLPILRAVQDEADIQYHITSFAALEKNLLREESLRGSDWQAAYANNGFNALTPDERESMKTLLDSEMNQREEETVCALRVEAVNVGKTPNYAFFKAPHCTPVPDKKEIMEFSGGKAVFTELNKVYAVALIDGKAMSDEEMAVLVEPGQKVVFDILVPHSPLPEKRAEKLFAWDFERQLDACRNFWMQKLESAAKIKVPETAIDERIQAGLLHCDINTLGLEKDGPLLATVGWYAPIGTESAPMIQIYDSMGWHKLAERCIDFFLTRQKENGYIQNYSDYQSETGPLIWTAGEHFRYTRDMDWLKRVMPQLKKAANFLLEWRERNKGPEFRDNGCYGLLDGKIADPEDYYHSYFLNAGTYAGLSRLAEMAAVIDPDYAAELQKELTAYRQDIRNSVYFAQAKAPLVPLGDGSWAPALPGWAEYTGANHLYADGENTFTHGSFLLRAGIVGANWLIYQEVLDANENAADFIIKTNQYPLTRDNAALSQPYYSRHDFIHIKRGEVKAFLKAYYNQFTALQDRETYTFWEHYHHASEHKTHEEAWFLMQTRWMLWFEDGERLSLLRAIPRRWLEDGREIALENVKSYFGPVSLKVESNLAAKQIKASFSGDPERLPEKVELRLPHPEQRPASSCEGGDYNPASESVMLHLKNGKAEVVLKF